MNVLFLLRSTDPRAGGVETATQNLARIFADQGYGVFVAAYGDSPNSPYCGRQLILDHNRVGENIENVRRYITDNNIDTIINQIYYLPINTLMLEDLQLWGAVRILMCLHTTPTYYKDQYRHSIAFSSSRDFKQTIKWILRIGALPYYWYIRIVKHRRLLWRDYSASDKFVVLSQSYKELFCRLFPRADKDKIEVIYNAMDDRFFDTPILVPKQNEMIYVGRLAVEKQIELTLQVWSKVSKQLPDWCFRVVGDGPWLEHLKKYVTANSIERVEWCGFTSETLPYYDRAKMLILTSLHEGLPMTVVEAQCRGVVPVLSNSFGAASEMVSNSSGVIVEIENVENEMPKIIAELANNLVMFEDMSQKAISKSRSYHKSEIWKHWQTLLAK